MRAKLDLATPDGPYGLPLSLRRTARRKGLQTSAFDFDLPDEQIAQHPVEPRDRARLMVVRRREGSWEHRTFADLPDLLRPGDVLVRNNTRVVPARLVGHREATGGKWEGLFLRDRPDGSWEILATTRGRPAPGERVVVGNGLILVLEAKCDDGRWLVRPDGDVPAHLLLDQHGQVPLPPYIRKGREGPGDRERYQTIYARAPGAVAAPTAGLHFTETVLRRLADRAIACVDVTLHVGLGTFRPIESERIDDHVLHSEWGEIDAAVVTLLNERRGEGGRVVAVGTTSTRLLETAARGGSLRPFSGETALYLRPGHQFRGLDALITNFHLPRSSLLVLVSAFAGVELIRAAYAEAVREGYRFYSFGDAMLVL
jgi:S-adenosylmethionine:tRNA ribosyltransferase-isomerase